MEFETTVDWRGKYPGTVVCQNGQIIDYSPPVEFGGIKGPLSPEDAFVGSANMCLQIVFRRVAADLGLTVLKYCCRAVGDLQTVEGARKLVKIVLYPELRLAEGSRIENLDKAIAVTKRRCVVTNSVDIDVEVVPKVL